MDPHSQNGSSHEENGPNPKKPKPTYITAAEIADEFSHHNPSFARINNGSFGSCPKSILAAQSELQLFFLSQPDDFFINHLHPSFLRSRSFIKDLVNADSVDEITIVDNATTAAAIVLQKIAWAFHENIYQKGDAVVMLHYAYGSVKKSMQAYVGRAGGHVIEVRLPFPVSSDDEIIDEFRKAISIGKENGRKVRLALIDHITSMPMVVIPVKELVRICREEGVDKVFVDAAHALGNVEVDVTEIGADFYTSNLHKWTFGPPSAAFLYSRKSVEVDDLHHPVVSSEYGRGLPNESVWIGTRDYSSQLVVPRIFQFWDRFEGGLKGITRRNHENVVEMGKMLVKAWGTCLGTAESMSCNMVMVGFPPCLKIECADDAWKLRTYLRTEFKIEVSTYYNTLKKENEGGTNGASCSSITAYARISHQVYNVEEDYYRFRDAINKLVKDGFHCGMILSSTRQFP